MENNMDYKMKKNDSSIEIIREKEEFYGLKESYPRSFPKSYLDFSTMILLDKDIIGNFAYQEGKPSLLKIKKNNPIWKKLGIELQDVQILKPGHEDREFTGKTTKEMVEALEIASPLKIPITFIEDYLQTHASIVHVTTEHAKSVIFRKIYLPMLEEKINSVIYAHELTHVELNDVGSGIEEYIHKETIPIFIEQLFAEEIGKDTLELARNNRFATMAAGIEEMASNKNMNFETRINLETYLISTLQAMKLANTYFQGNEKIKKEMISYINKMFLGESLTEDMLEHFDSYYEDIEPDLKVLRKIK